MTGRDFVSASLRLIGVLASGETLDAAMATDGLAALNRLLDSWSTESLLVPAKVREVFPLVSGKGTYTLGMGGDFSTPRPIRIENVEIQILSGTYPLELPIKMLSEDEYARETVKALSSTYPAQVYDDGAYPLRTLSLWPVPAEANNLVIYSTKPLSNVTLGSQISLPPGYERALIFNNSVDLAPEYGRAVPDVVAAIAIESKAAIKRANKKQSYLTIDSALTSHRRGMGSGLIVIGGGSNDDCENCDGGTF